MNCLIWFESGEFESVHVSQFICAVHFVKLRVMYNIHMCVSCAFHYKYEMFVWQVWRLKNHFDVYFLVFYLPSRIMLFNVHVIFKYFDSQIDYFWNHDSGYMYLKYQRNIHGVYLVFCPGQRNQQRLLQG